MFGKTSHAHPFFIFFFPPTSFRVSVFIAISSPPASEVLPDFRGPQERTLGKRFSSDPHLPLLRFPFYANFYSISATMRMDVTICNFLVGYLTPLFWPSVILGKFVDIFRRPLTPLSVIFSLLLGRRIWSASQVTQSVPCPLSKNFLPNPTPPPCFFRLIISSRSIPVFFWCLLALFQALRGPFRETILPRISLL